MLHLRLTLLICLVCPVLSFGQTPNQHFDRPPSTFVSILVPGSVDTHPASINDSGDVTGWYSINANEPARGFIRYSNGQFITFEVGSYGTAPTSINARGDVTGGWTTIENGIAVGAQGFIRDHLGAIATFEVPGSTAVWPVEINASGTVVGYYSTASNYGNPFYGFTRSAKGVISTFSGPSAQYTFFTGINDAGEIIGISGNSVNQTFFSLSNGVLTPLTAYPESINQEGDIVGLDGAAQGLVRWHNGTTTTFSVPGSAFDGSYLINNQGNVTGNYQLPPDGCSTCNGFLWSPDGVFTYFNPPNSTNTIPTGFNNSNVVIGYYYTGPPFVTELGFMRFPGNVP